MRRLIILLSLLLALSACSPQTIAIVVTATPPPVQGGRVIEVKGTPVVDRQNSIDWTDAGANIGERKTVCGPVVGANYAKNTNGQPTFLDIGRAYPDPKRFQVVIWGKDRPKFPRLPEEAYRGATICVTGLIEEYRGGAEIQVNDPSQIR